MTKQEKIKAILGNRNLFNTFANLWERWQDEKEYEDINEYGKVLFKKLTELHPNFGVTYVGANKRPFGIRVTIDGTTLNIFVKTQGNRFVFGAAEV